MIRNPNPGRNDPCPCGSKTKYKKCCGAPTSGTVRIESDIPEHIMQQFDTRIREERHRVAQFGHVNRMYSCHHQGRKFVAVGDRVEFSGKWRTPIDFLCDYSMRKLGTDWAKTEWSKPLHNRHEIMKMHNSMRIHQARHRPGPDGLCACIPNGPMQAFLLLAYDLYTLDHHQKLQASIVKRLKYDDQFQGARHEFFAVATCIRAGCTIDFEDETDPNSKHPELIATHRATGQKIAVEAKSKHRDGVLGRAGVIQPVEMLRAGVRRLLRDAIRKPVAHPYVVFVDLNLPMIGTDLLNSRWSSDIFNSIADVTTDGTGASPINLIVLSNQPNHYALDEDPAPDGCVWLILLINPRIPAAHPQAIAAIDSAARKFGNIPKSFEEAS